MKKTVYFMLLAALVVLALPHMKLPDGPHYEAQGDEQRLARTPDEDQEDEKDEKPGQLDEGKELLPKARITLQQAVKAATGAAKGKLGAVDLEYDKKGRLVFNVDVGDKDVQVDARTGKVLTILAEEPNGR